MAVLGNFQLKFTPSGFSQDVSHQYNTQDVQYLFVDAVVRQN